MLPLTVPLRLLVAVAVDTLNALSNAPVEPLFSATERCALAFAAPERLFVLLSERLLLVVVVVVLLLLRLRTLLSERVSVAVFEAVLLLSLVLLLVFVLVRERLSLVVLVAVLLLSLVLLSVRERLSLVVLVAVLLLSLVLLSVRERLSLVVLVAVLLLSLVLLLAFERVRFSVELVVLLLLLVSVLVAVEVLLPPAPCSVVLASATPLMPNATAMAEAKSVFFIKPPTRNGTGSRVELRGRNSNQALQLWCQVSVRVVFSHGRGLLWQKNDSLASALQEGSRQSVTGG